MANTGAGAVSAQGNAKAIAAGLAGAVATILVYAIDQATGKALPPEIVASVQTLMTGLAVWLTPHNLGSN